MSSSISASVSHVVFISFLRNQICSNQNVLFQLLFRNAPDQRVLICVHLPLLLQLREKTALKRQNQAVSRVNTLVSTFFLPDQHNPKLKRSACFALLLL